MTGWIIRPARETDLDAVLGLLTAAELPADGVQDHFPAAYAVAEVHGRVAGAAGLERYGEYGLLRSVVVDAAVRGTGLGDALVRERLTQCSGDVFLLTTTAARWFPRYGFVPVAREAVPAAVRASVEFASACPASAAVFVRRSA